MMLTVLCQRRVFLFSLFLVLGFFLIPYGGFAQLCPLCKIALIHSPEGRHLARAFNHGILFLLGMPYLVFGILFLLIRRLGKKGFQQ